MTANMIEKIIRLIRTGDDKRIAICSWLLKENKNMVCIKTKMAGSKSTYEHCHDNESQIHD